MHSMKKLYHSNGEGTSGNSSPSNGSHHQMPRPATKQDVLTTLQMRKDTLSKNSPRLARITELEHSLEGGLPVAVVVHMMRTSTWDALRKDGNALSMDAGQVNSKGTNGKKKTMNGYSTPLTPRPEDATPSNASDTVDTAPKPVIAWKDLSDAERASVLALHQKHVNAQTEHDALQGLWLEDAIERDALSDEERHETLYS